MPARRVKTFLRNPNLRNHREHRSKRGRSYGRMSSLKKEAIRRIHQSDREVRMFIRRYLKG